MVLLRGAYVSGEIEIISKIIDQSVPILGVIMVH